MEYKPFLRTYFLRIKEEFWKFEKIEYKFQMDGNWVVNPIDDVLNNNMGTQNNIIRID